MQFLTHTQPFFPRFSQRAPQFGLEHVLPPSSVAEVAKIERSLGIALPDSYKQLLQCARGFWLMGGVVQFGKQHPFIHKFEPSLAREGDVEGFRAYVRSEAFLRAFSGL